MCLDHLLQSLHGAIVRELSQHRLPPRNPCSWGTRSTTKRRGRDVIESFPAFTVDKTPFSSGSAHSSLVRTLGRVGSPNPAPTVLPVILECLGIYSVRLQSTVSSSRASVSSSTTIMCANSTSLSDPYSNHAISKPSMEYQLGED